jgi:hypothetical protein
MKRLASFLGFFFCLFAVTLWVSQSFVNRWEPTLRQVLEARLSEALHARVEIDDIALPLPYRVRLDNVHVWESGTPEKLIFRAASISLTLSLIDIPRAITRRQPLEAIGLVSVDTPWLVLSRELLTAHQKRREAASKVHVWPLLFTLSWEQGTFQWRDPAAPHGTWTMYQSRGAYRIRGPSTSFATRGSLEQADKFRFQFSTLARRWNAQAYVRGGDIGGVASLLSHVLQRPVLPDDWKAGGRFDLDLRASGRHHPTAGDKPWEFLQEGRLAFSQTQIQHLPSGAPVDVSGEVMLKGPRLSTSGLSLTVEKQTVSISGQAWPFGGKPHLDVSGVSRNFELSALSHIFQGPSFLEGKAEVQMHAKGDLYNPDIELKTSSHEGHLLRRPFENAQLTLRRQAGRLEFVDSSVQLLEGRVRLTGYASATANDLQVTGEGLSLQQVIGPDVELLDGRLNFSSSLHGPADAFESAGSFWISNLTMGSAAPQDLEGSFELNPSRLVITGAAKQGHARLSAEVTRENSTVTLDHLELRLPSGAVLSAGGQYAVKSAKVQGVLEASGLAIPDDLPFLKRWIPMVRATASGEGDVSGTLQNPELTARARSDDVRLAGQPTTSVQGTLHWKPGLISFSSFKTANGVEGEWTQALTAPHDWSLRLGLQKAPGAWLSLLIFRHPLFSGGITGNLHLARSNGYSGAGDLKLQDGAFGQWPVHHSALIFDMRPSLFELKTFSMEGDHAAGRFHGRAVWPSTAAPTVRFEMDGRAAADTSSKPLWETPLHASGELHPAEEWRGTARLQAARPVIRGTAASAAETTLSWDPQHLAWDHFHWGPPWASEGSLRFSPGASPVWAAHFTAQHVSLSQWLAIFMPEHPAPLQGFLDGDVSLTGPIDQWAAALQGQIHQGAWQALRWEGRFDGRWSSSGIDPLQGHAVFAEGGQADFHGAYHLRDKSLQGSLKVDQIALRPVGATLAFPKPLQGHASATLTVSGALPDPKLTGHLETGAVIYGDAEHPIQVQQSAFDVTMAASPDRANVWRLTITEGLVKTAEEQVRLAGGSFVEWAEGQAARLKLSSQIRNLHLGVFTLFGGLDLDGTWQAKSDGFALHGDAQTRGLFINDYELEQGRITADYEGSVLRFQPAGRGASLITGSIDFRKSPQLLFKDFFISGADKQGLTLSGTVGPSLWDFQLRGRAMDLGTLGGLSGFPYPLSGTADVAIHGSGDVDHPHLDGTVSVRDGRAMGIGFHSGEASFIWQDTRMTFTRLWLSDPGRYTLAGTGVFPVTSKSKRRDQDRSIDFSVRLQDSNLGLLQSISDEVKQAHGNVDGILQIRGTPEQPRLSGSIHVSDGDVVGAHYFKRLRHIRLDTEFDRDQLIVKTLEGTSGEGVFRSSGTIAFSGFEPRAYNLHADITSAKGLSVQVPELAIPESPLAKRFRFLTTVSNADLKGHVSFKGPAESPVFKGDAYISNGHFTFPPSHKNPPPPGLMDWFRRIAWNVNLHFGDGAWFENELVEANLSGNLALKGPSERLRVDGGMDITEGKISYLGVEFDIRQARFDMRPEESDAGLTNIPYVRGIAESHVQAIDTVSGQAGSNPNNRLDVNDTITLMIDYAPVDQIKPRLVSATNPTLSQEKLLARVTQIDTTNLSPAERNYMYQQQMVRLIDTSLATPLAKRILKPTGLVDTVRVSRIIDPAASTLPDSSATGATAQQQTSTSLLANTKYTFEKNLSSKLSLGYGMRFIENTVPVTLESRLDLVNDVELSYRWFRNVYLRGSFDLPSSNPSIVPDRKVTIEPQWRFGWWGNTNKNKIPKTDRKP